MTTITTCLGLAPLALGLGGKSRIWSPFATSFVWGLAFSMVITLFVIPAGYCIAYDAAAAVRRWRGGALPEADPDSDDATVSSPT